MHVPFEGPGYIEDWFLVRGMELRTWQLYDKSSLPAAEDVDFLLIMGGPMNIYQHDKYPVLEAEKELIGQCIHSGARVLGICLGAQLVADALGEKTYPGNEKEIGWFPVAGDRETLPGSFVPFHWHGETFDLPDQAKHLASSLAYRNQAFSYGENVLALQFHLEVTPDLVEGLLEHAAADLTPGNWVQSPEQIREGLKYIEKNRDILFDLLGKFTDMAG
jgi:GMP synthase-like glutamine amidotransferase